MEQNYVINVNAPQVPRTYDWYKDSNDEWQIKKEYCTNCHLKINQFMKFCPYCGFKLLNVQNLNPPKEENE